jgi:lipid II:glycine glycyltransferase (peptidoglycan interpeptide bridge formation enzyme)
VVCQIKSWITGSRLVSLPFSDHCEPICDSKEDLKSLVYELKAGLKTAHWRYLEVRPTSDNFAQMASELEFRPTGRYLRHVIDLRPEIDEMFHRFHKGSVQRRVRHAERSGLVERCGTTSEKLDDFYRLFVLTRSRHHLPPPPLAWFKNLVDCQGAALEIRVAYKDEMPIAAILTLRFRETGYFKYGCSDARFNRFGATPWLLWNAIRAAKAAGALWFDFGRTQTDNPGLLTFKNHWAPRSEPLTYWRYPASPYRDAESDWKLRTAKRFFSHLPKGLLVSSGKLIYPHIG